ncbi:MAG: glycine cleavage system protein H [Candidatus Heimdallarchaeaceae archaeon]
MKRHFDFPEELLYYSTYIWLEKRGRDIYRIGLTDYCQFNLDDVISVSLPEEGILVDKGEEIASIDSIEDTLTIKAPISGTIKEINKELRQSPELINESPYEEGWIVEMELGSPDDEDDLLDSSEILDKYHEELDEQGIEEEYEDEEDTFGYGDNIEDF